MKNQPTILLVDDDLHLRKTLTDILSLKGFNALAVGKGAEALEKVKQEGIAVALIDLRLEDMPGLEVLRGIKQYSKETECILLTGYASQTTAIEAINLGAFAYYVKPLDIDQMLLSIQQAIAKRQAGRDLKESQELYRTFINATVDMAFLKDDAFRYLIANEENVRFLRKPLAEIIGKTDFELMDASLAKGCRASDEAALKDKTTVVSIEPVGDRYYETRKFPVPLQGGKVGVGGYIRDITEVRTAQEALRQSENHYRGLFEDSPISLWEEDFSGVKKYLDGLKKQGVKDFQTYFSKHPKAMEECAALIKVVDVNKASLELFHVSSKEELVADLSRIFREDSYKEFRDELVSVAEGRKQFNWEGINYTPDGERLEIAMTWSVSPGHEADLSKVIISLVDITERKRAEKALVESEERFRGLFENASVGIYRTAPDGRILMANPALLNMLGYSDFSELVQINLKEEGFGPEFSREEFRKRVETGDGVRGLESAWYRRDKSTIYVRESARAIRDAQGQVLYYEGIVEEVTERRLAEAAVARSEERLALALQAANDGYWDWNLLTNEIYYSPQWYRMLGYEPDSFAGNYDTFRKLVHPEDIASIEQAFENAKKAGTGYDLEFRMRAKDGSWKWIRSRSMVVPVSGSKVATRMVGTHSDITERRLAEDQLRLQAKALDSAANAMVITNRDGVIEWINPAYTLLTGYSAEDVLGQNPRVLKSGAQAPAFYKDMWDTILSGSTWHGELINKRKDGRLYNEEQTITPLLNAKGEIEHFIGIKNNITELLSRKQELEALAQVSEALRVAGGRKEMVPIILEQVQNLLHAKGALLNWQDAETGEISVELGIDELGYETGRVFPAHTGVSGLILDTGEPYLTDDIYKDGLFLEPDRAPETIKALIGYPLISLGKPIGALLVGRPLPFTAEEERLLAAVANMAVNALQRVTLHEQTELRLQHLITLREIDRAITTSFDLKVTLNVLLSNILLQLGVDAADVLIMDKEGKELVYSGSLGFRTNAIEGLRIKVGMDFAGRAALNNKGVYVADIAKVRNSFTHSIVDEEGFVSYYVWPISAKGKVNGVVEIFHRSPLKLDTESLDFLDMLMGQAAIAVDNAHLFEDLQKSNVELMAAYDATIEGWVQALDLRDKETEGHTLRVADMAVDLARDMGLPEEALTQMRRGALLHDIGKMAVPDAILNKPAGLTPEEWKIMRMHPVYAYNMLAGIAYLKPALEVPYCHHEKWDGSGYPRGLKGEEIPLAARIFAVIDVWDALCSDRPYRPAWKEEDALKFIQEQAGMHFDPQVVEKFIGVMQKKAYFK